MKCSESALFCSGTFIEKGAATMDFKTTLSNLYFLLIHADGKVSENEIIRGKQMMQAEGIDEFTFELMLNDLKQRDRKEIYTEGLQGLKKLNAQTQIRCIAWLCVVANADGFMDREEWSLIYRIYQTELNLKLDDIMTVQKSLSKQVHERAYKKHQNNSFAIL